MLKTEGTTDVFLTIIFLFIIFPTVVYGNSTVSVVQAKLEYFPITLSLNVLGSSFSVSKRIVPTTTAAS